MPNPTAPQPDLHDYRLRYLFLCHEKGSMRAVAETLGIAASSVSRQVAKLEEEIGIELIKKSTHKVCLTAAGLLLVDYYVQRMSQQTALFDQLAELQAREGASTVIAIGEGLLGVRAIASLQAFLRQHTAHKAEIITAPSFEVQRMVLADEAHLGVVFSPSAIARLNRLFSVPQPLRMIVHRQSPLASRSSISLREIAHEPLVLPGANFRVRQLVDDACKHQPFQILPALTSNSLTVILDFVRSGLGATLLAELPVIEELKAGTFKAIAISHDEMNSTEIQIVARRGRALDELSRALAIEMAKAVRMAI